jgi:hypothetical protein
MNWLLDLTPDEWNAVRLSIKVATVAMIASLHIDRACARPRTILGQDAA